MSTGYFLHSHPGISSEVSQQQEVTCFWIGDENDYWIVKAVTSADNFFRVQDTIVF